MRGSTLRALACSIWIAFYGCVLPGFENVERAPEGAGSGGASGAAGSVVASAGGASSVSAGGSGGDLDVDAGSGIDSGPGDCPVSRPYGACDVEGLCPYPRMKMFCMCDGRGSSWVCQTCPTAQPWTGAVCPLPGMSCGYGVEPNPYSCVCMADPGGLHWMCSPA